MDSLTADEPSQSPIRFRAGTKRKAYRQRTDPQSPPPAPVNAPQDRDDHDTTTTNTRHPEAEDGDQDAVAAALRARSARKVRRRGVGFTSESRPGEDNDERAMVLRGRDEDDDAPVVLGIADRFTLQTGLVSALDDRHITEYIESRLSSRSTAPQGAAVSPIPQTTTTKTHAVALDSRPPDQAVTQGKLMEVDIVAPAPPPRGAEDATTAATTLPGAAGGTKRKRLGKDGKPWRSRNRRGSDDVKRDQLVEAFLHENRLDVYDRPEPSPPRPEDLDDDGAADERLAEQFQRQYMDSLEQRRQKKKPAARTTTTTRGQQGQQQGAEDVLKGPKLGGSRNARAAVRNALLQKEKDGKK